ncbi:hypothetical protein BDV95DRAFT_502620 [Massariosphaeria phaeospora]|uniref:Uncharacterized protein n=1 Tax=Massariosphaeria phaeospora TaxID=100035 RepID=A0A7C8I488_9PLEO|nr:hypothetical protein BDV95DRAFT_502620 [Massariosphaeria phaeospora]
MLSQYVLVALVAAVSAVPLNINLGAYSPALVVGDGEITLGTSESASELMSTLQTGAAPAAEGEQPAEENAAKRAPNLRRSIDNILGKRADQKMAAVEGAMDWIKRDLPGFEAALTYAREAMQNTPKIELGTEHSGVGIIVNAGLNVPADSAANGEPAAERKAKRQEVVAEESDAPKMTLVAITEV